MTYETTNTEQNRVAADCPNERLVMPEQYDVGDDVEVKMPHGWRHGKVKKVLPEYAWTGRTHYEITGKEMITIASARVMRIVS